MEKVVFFRSSLSSETGGHFALELGGHFDRFFHAQQRFILFYSKFKKRISFKTFQLAIFFIIIDFVILSAYIPFLRN